METTSAGAAVPAATHACVTTATPGITRRALLIGVGAASLSALSLGRLAGAPRAAAASLKVNGFTISDPILALWKTARTAVGNPTSNAYSVRDGVRGSGSVPSAIVGSATKQRFQNADMYARGKNASIIKGRIRSTYNAGGGSVSFGIPSGVERKLGEYASWYQKTERGHVWWSSGDGGKAVSALETVRMKGVANFRDVASGTGLELSSGGETSGSGMLAKNLYRASKLKPMTAMDKAILVTLGIKTVIDLRTPNTVARTPDPVIPGVKLITINLYGTPTAPGITPTSTADAIAHMERLNRNYVADSLQRTQIGTIVTAIADATGPVLFHCTEGKDRTGWIAAVLQLVCGVTQKTVLTEYLKSNAYNKALTDASYAKDKAAHGTAYADRYRCLAVVQESYLRAGLTELASRYGSVDAYLTAGCGVSAATLAALRGKLRG